MQRFAAFAAVAALAGCLSVNPQVRRIEDFVALRQAGDPKALTYLAAGARIWYETKSGAGEAYGSAGRWDHWDQYFHSRARFSDWRVRDGAISAVVHETNDYYALLEWKPVPYRMTWWLDENGRIREVLLQKLPGQETNRLAELREWAAAAHPGELADLMPNGQIDPTGDRPERWRALLTEWRIAAGIDRKMVDG